jgi:hypothetical protein
VRTNVAVADTGDQQALAEAVTQLLELRWPAGTARKQVIDPASVSEQPLMAGAVLTDRDPDARV